MIATKDNVAIFTIPLSLTLSPRRLGRQEKRGLRRATFVCVVISIHSSVEHELPKFVFVARLIHLFALFSRQDVRWPV